MSGSSVAIDTRQLLVVNVVLNMFGAFSEPMMHGRTLDTWPSDTLQVQCSHIDTAQVYHPTTNLALAEKLYDLLSDVSSNAGVSFSGTGLVVSSNPSLLPLTPLRTREDIDLSKTTRDRLISISDLANEYHDGFHVISPEFHISRISQYFSTPVVFGLSYNRNRRSGARYMAALLGSTLPDVLLTGVASAVYGVVVFAEGRELISTR